MPLTAWVIEAGGHVGHAAFKLAVLAIAAVYYREDSDLLELGECLRLAIPIAFVMKIDNVAMTLRQEMREFNEDVKRTLSETRLRVAETGFNHITTAIGLFEDTAFSQACFLAMTGIEEMGKARTLQLVQSDAVVDEEPARIDAKGIERFLREHRLKATRAGASGLSVNHGAVRRHGRHEEADLNLTSGILFLTESNQWMDIRNRCLYSDVDIHSKQVKWPAKRISGDYAYYFICMCLEIMAKESDAGFGSPIEKFESGDGITDFQSASQFEDHILYLLEQFMNMYQDEFEETNLDFFTQHPQYDSDREKVRQNEVSVDDGRRENVEEMFREIVSGIDEPDEENKEQLPDSVSYEDYQEEILQYMVDIGMDMPYFTKPGLHPDIRELHSNITEYIEYE